MNVAASVHQRLLNLARARKRPFNELVQYYAMERVLARLVAGRATDRFVLKGALALRTWEPSATRPTRDIDLLALTADLEVLTSSALPTVILETLRACLDTPLQDGVWFDGTSLTIQPITAQTDEAGGRITFRGTLGTTRLAMQVDVGFGDIAEPAPVWVEYPQLLAPATLRVLAYRRETIVAEKFHAILARGTATSRFKDFHDVWLLGRSGGTDEQNLRRAIHATFTRRTTPLPHGIPDVLTHQFADDSTITAQWAGFARRAGAADTIPPLTTIVDEIAAWLLPLCQH